MMDMDHGMPLWQALLSGLLGVMYLLSGYRTLRFTARVTSALLFMGLGTLAAAHVSHPAAALGMVLGAGLVGFLLGNAFYFLSVALYGAAGGLVLAALFNLLAGGHQLGWPLGVGGAMAGALLAVLFERPIGILGTSLVGGALIMKALHAILVANGVHAPGRYAGGYVLLVVVLGILGGIVQAKTTRDLPPPQRRDHAGRGGSKLAA